MASKMEQDEQARQADIAARFDRITCPQCGGAADRTRTAHPRTWCETCGWDPISREDSRLAQEAIEVVRGARRSG